MSRLSTLKVLEELRPQQTVTLCLPLFLAGDEKERAFAKVFPTIAIDGCDKQCASRATELYSAKPAKSVIVSDFLKEHKCSNLQSRRMLTKEEHVLKDVLANELASVVDELLSFKPTFEITIDTLTDEPLKVETNDSNKNESTTANCDCGINLPVSVLEINKVETNVAGLSIIFDLFYEQNKLHASEIMDELLDKVKLYNTIPAKDVSFWKNSLEKEYNQFIKAKNARL